MLDLYAGVHLHEIVGAVLVQQELDRAGGIVADLGGQFHRRGAHLRAELRRDGGRRGLLDQFLVPALDRTLPLAQMEVMPVLVPEQLDLDVPRVGQEFLHVDGVVPERGRRLVPGQGVSLDQFGLVPGHPHALAAAAGGRLDDHRIAHLVGVLDRVSHFFDDPRTSGNRRHARRLGGLARLGLVAHAPDHVRRGADPREFVLLADLGEFGVLGQEPVPRMDRVGPGDLGRGDDVGDVEVALAAGALSDTDRFVRVFHVQGFGIRARMHGHAFDAQFPAGPHDAQGDFAPVGDEDLLEHVKRRLDVRLRPGRSFSVLGDEMASLG